MAEDRCLDRGGAVRPDGSCALAQGRPVYVSVHADGRVTVDGKPLEDSRDPVAGMIRKQMQRDGR